MIVKKSLITISTAGILILGVWLVGVLSVIPGVSYACYTPPPPPPPLPPPPPPPPPPSPPPPPPDPCSEDPCTPSTPPKDEKEKGDPVSLKSGAFNYSCKDLVIKGRSLDVIIQRSYSSDAYNGEPAVFDFSFDCYYWGQVFTGVTDVNWVLPVEAYEVKHEDFSVPAGWGCCHLPPYYCTRTYMQFRVPSGSYQVKLILKDIYWWCFYGQVVSCGGVVRRENTYSYNINGSEYSSRFGHGWDMSYNIKIRDYGDPNTIAFFDGHNRRFTYRLKSGTNPAEYTPPAGRYDKLVKNQNGTYTLTEKDGKKYEFDNYGWLSAIKDRVGNSITFDYSGSGHSKILTKITDDLGRDITLSYNGKGLLSTITDFAGRTWTYTYDPCNNDLLSVRGPTSLTTSYGYQPPHLLETITDPNGQTYLVNSYDGSRVYQQFYGYNHSSFVYNDSNETTYTDRRGYVSKTIYNEYGHALKEIAYTDGLREADPSCYTTSYSYDANMNLTKKIFPSGSYKNYRYDPNGNRLLVAREPNNGDPNIVTRYTYEPKFNRVKTVTDPTGNITTFDYDSLTGSLKKIIFPQVATPAGPRNPQIGFAYNSYGQVETIRLPDGIVIKGEYGNDKPNDPNNYGRLTKVIFDANESDPCSMKIATVYEYDIRGNVIEVNDPCGNIAKFAYNVLDKLTKITDPLNNSTNLFYNNNKKVSRIEREKAGDDQIVKFSYDILDHIKTITDPCNYVTKLGYDYEENLSDVNDAEENNTRYQYDERNLLWKTVDANGGVSEYSYTPDGDLREIKDAKGNVTGYYYDGFGRLLRTQYPNDTNEVFTYDKNSNTTSKRNRKGDTIYYEYDALNQMTVKNRPSDPNICFTYNISGRIVEASDGRPVAQGGGVTRYSYDRIGRVFEVNDISSRVVKYNYDKLGRRTKLTYPDGSYVTYEYDALSRLTKVKYNGSTIAEYGYDELSRRTLLTYGNDANIVYHYDIANKLTRITNNMDTSSIDIEYSNYDKVGNRRSMKVNDANTQAYTYDNLYQLIYVDYNNGDTANYYYDLLGNRTALTNGQNVTYTSNNVNQYTAVADVNYAYDERGNLTYDGQLTYVYDCENELKEVKQGTTTIATYAYDYTGRRVRKTVGAVVTKYCYDGDEIIAEYNGDTLLRKFIYGPGIDEPIMMINVNGGETKYYYHYDGLGSVTALSNVNGQIVEQYHYDVFGYPNTVSSIGNRFMFTGREYDSEVGLYYYRTRYYKPSIGRFLQTDLIRYAAGLNMYTYCNNNPLNWIDPWGLDKDKDKDMSDYLEEVGTLPWHIPDEAMRIEKEEYGDYRDPFGGDYRHFLAGGMAARIGGPIGGAIGIRTMGDSSRGGSPGSDTAADAAAEWRGYRAALRHPFTPLRKLGKEGTRRPIGPKKIGK